MSNRVRRVCVGITGASGAVYSVRLIEVLLATGHDVHLSISPSGAHVIREEMDLSVDLEDFKPAQLMLDDVKHASDSKIQLLQASAGIGTADSNVLSVESGRVGDVFYHHYRDFQAPIASGSFLTQGMIVCPCSGTSLSAIAHSSAGNLIQRAAEVHLKERRKLILVPRETPLSLPQIENMRLATQAGAVVMPASPGWYHGVTTLRDLVDFMVARLCDQLGIDNCLINRWGAE
ncbi:UbiX family flavin prenyltransferase [Bythopirellula polymerisocia]|uniref:Flavin prenyltransferase UbiX n=1 Tax=Bythopirellula polymerisocia TaxID=2528003 RepID=A0A5C6CWQ5_9BACT|nr:flavin prenyltransferase UbiX [Bythopirellula polymerisocia]TWU27851.1 putative aromatic acid decarboxylase [Bythopirellula polymerisocia]